MKVEIQSDVSTANSSKDRLGAGPERNKVMHHILGCKTEYRTEISVSRMFLQRKLCRCWNAACLFFQYYNTIAILQKTADHASHTLLQDEGVEQKEQAILGNGYVG